MTHEDLLRLTGPPQGVSGVAADSCNAASAFFFLCIESAEVAWALAGFTLTLALSKSF